MIGTWRFAAMAAALHASASFASAQVSPGYRWDTPPVPPQAAPARTSAASAPQTPPAELPPVPRVESSRRNASAKGIRTATAPSNPTQPAQPPVEPTKDAPVAKPQQPSAPRAAAAAATVRPVEPRRLEAPSSNGLPILSVQAFGDDDATIGKKTTFRIAVRNLGQTVAQNVAVEVVVPRGIEIVATRPEGRSVTDGRTVFDAGSLSPNGERTIEIDAIPRESGAFDFQPRVRLAQTAGRVSAAPIPKDAALILEIHAPDRAAAGDRVACRAVVRNTGGLPAEDVTLVAEFPSTFETDADSRSERKLGVIPPGESREASFAVTPREGGTAPMTFRAVGAHDVSAEIAGQIEVLRRDLSLVVEGPALLPAGRSAVYSIVLKNSGETTLRNVVLRGVVPTGMQVQKFDRDARYEPHERVVTLSLPEIPAGSEETLRLLAVAATGDRALIFETVARAEGLTPVTAVHETEVALRADLAMNLVGETGPVRLDETATLSIRLTNRGSDVARKVKVRVLLPETIDAVGSDGETAQEVLVPAFDLGAGEEKTVLFQVRGRAAGDHLIQVILNSETLDRGLLQEANVFFYEASQKRVAARP